MDTFKPQSPDPFLQKDEDMSLAKFGHLNAIFSDGEGAPTSTPKKIGFFYTDTLNKKLYVATGTAASTDWTILN